MAVDEDPDVVVAGEVELLVAPVLEPVAELAREVEVVAVALVAEGAPIEREEGAVVEAVGARRDAAEGEPLDDRLVHSGNVPVPLVEVRSAAGGRGGRRAGVHRAAIGAEQIADDPRVVAEEVLEVGVAHPEVAVDDGDREARRLHAGVHAREAFFDEARPGAAIAIAGVAVVARLGRETDGVAAHRDAGSVRATGLGAAEGIAAIAEDVVAVITRLGSLTDAIAAGHRPAGTADGVASKPFLEGARRIAAVAGRGGRVAVLAVLGARDDSVAAGRSGAGQAHVGAGPTRLDGARWTAAVACGGVAVVAGLAGPEGAVAADHQPDAG